MNPHRRWSGHFEGTLHPATPAELDRELAVHRHPLEGVASFELGGSDTPLGALEADDEWCGAKGLSARGVRPCAPFAEHAVEVQLPLVQCAWSRARIVPLVFGRCEGAQTLELGLARPSAWNPGTRFLANTDLSHYHDRRAARALDDHLEAELVGGDPAALLGALLDHRVEACVVGYLSALAVGAAPAAARGGDA